MYFALRASATMTRDMLSHATSECGVQLPGTTAQVWAVSQEPVCQHPTGNMIVPEQAAVQDFNHNLLFAIIDQFRNPVKIQLGEKNILWPRMSVVNYV